jgi:alkylation response protein AidB-like acyl-CoA dehydrogenase
VSALVVASDFAVLSAIRAQLRDDRVYLATTEETARAVADRRKPDFTFYSVKRRTDMRWVKRLMKADPGAAAVIVTARGMIGMNDVARTVGARGYMPEYEITLVTRRLVEMIREDLSKEENHA